MTTKDRNRQESTVRIRKDLDELDRTDGRRYDHYSAADVAEACHATEGQDHE
jgi:hypothetical protein